MDLQMPVMDGYTATARIRANPAWASLPVLAMTANAMAEDRAKVAQAGMNDHIPKPIVAAELMRALLRWIAPRRHGEGEAEADAQGAEPGTAEGAGAAKASAGHAGAPGDPLGGAVHVALPEDVAGLDVALALQRTGGKPALLARLLRELVADHGDDAQRIAQALAEGRLDEARRIAHTLKGVAGTLGAPALQRAAAALEAALQAGQPAEQERAALRRELSPMMAGLRDWVNAQRDGPGRSQGGGWGPAQASGGHGGDGSDGGMHEPAAPHAERVRVLAEELATLLADMDPAAAEVAEALARALRDDPARAGVAADLARHAAAFAFDEAAHCLASLPMPG
jgi:two-component system sensor histidine kinase/response regulator